MDNTSSIFTCFLRLFLNKSLIFTKNSEFIQGRIIFSSCSSCTFIYFQIDTKFYAINSYLYFHLLFLTNLRFNFIFNFIILKFTLAS